jgi:multiple sugar transport system ATP-binding protein
MAAVTLRGVSKLYGRTRALDDVCFHVADGELMVLVGPSGCGKSTLLRLIAGLESVSGGTIEIGERDVTELEPRQRDIAMVFQSYALYPHMTVEQNLGFSLKLRGQSASRIRQRVQEAARRLELEPLLGRLPRQLSGGQRQRVALGRALVRQPQVFLLDEPLSNLDAKLRASMRTEITRLHRSLGTTMIYVTHDQVEAMTLGQRIVVLDRGRVQQIDTPMRIYEQPANLFVAGFLGNPAMNFLHGRVAQGEGGALLLQGEGAALLLEQGTTLGIPSSLAPLAGRELIVGIRPEDLQPLSPGDDSSPSQLRATVELVEAIGNEAFIHLRAGGWPLILRTAPHGLPEVGATLGLQAAVTRLHFFDPNSGARLAGGETRARD